MTDDVPRPAVPPAPPPPRPPDTLGSPDETNATPPPPLRFDVPSGYAVPSPSGPPPPDFGDGSAPRFGGSNHAAASGDAEQRIDEYRILRKLGEGGMGAVYLAEDVRLGRRVAVKTMRRELAADAGNRARFFREARAAAAVEHDHVVPIWRIGEGADGSPFIAMPFLQGESLECRLKREPLPPLELVLRVAREVAAGLGAAHARGLTHRDVKPDNVWLEGDPESPDPAARVRRCKLLDFGLARDFGNEDMRVTTTGALLGTPMYMSPEQARGQTLDARADLFSLGVMLYRMTTGKFPFEGPTVMSVLTALATVVPPTARTRNPEVPADVSDLIERLMKKDPAARPGSAEEVAEEVARIVADRERALQPPPVAAEPARGWGLLTGMLFLGLVGAGYGLLQIETQRRIALASLQRLEAERQAAHAGTAGTGTRPEGSAGGTFDPRQSNAPASAEESARALERLQAAQAPLVVARDRALYESYVARVGLIQADLERDRFRRGGRDIAEILAAPAPPGEPEPRHWEWGRLRYVAGLGERHRLPPGFGRPDALIATPDGKTAYVAAGKGLFAFDAGKPEARPIGGPLPAAATGLGFAADGVVLIRTVDGKLYGTDAGGVLPAGKPWTARTAPVGRTHPAYPGPGFAALPDGMSVVLADGNLTVRDKTDALVWEYRPAAGASLTAVAVTEAYEILAGDAAGHLLLFPPATDERRGPGKFLPPIVERVHAGKVNALVYDAARRRCLSGGDDRAVRVRRVIPPAKRTGQGVFVDLPDETLPGGSAAVTAMASVNSDRLWTASADGLVRRWNPRTDLARFVSAVTEAPSPGPSLGPMAEFRRPNGNGRLVSAAGTSGVAIWERGPLDVAWSNPRTYRDHHTGRVQRFDVYEGNGKRLALTWAEFDPYDVAVRVWDLDAGREVRSLQLSAGGVARPRFAPDGSAVVIGDADAVTRFWDWEEGSLRGRRRQDGLGERGIGAIGFRNADRLLVSFAGTIRESNGRDAESKQPPFEYRGHASGAFDLLPFPDGKGFVSLGRDGQAIAWRYGVSTGDTLPSVGPLKAGLVDGPNERLFLAGEDRRLTTIDLKTRTVVGTPLTFPTAILSPALSGPHLLVVTEDGNLARLDRKTGKQIAPPQPLPEFDDLRLCGVHVLADGSLLTARFRAGYGTVFEIRKGADWGTLVARFGAPVRTIGVVPSTDNRLFATISDDGSIRKRNADVGSSQPLRQADAGSETTAFAATADTARYAFGNAAGEVQLVNPLDGAILQRTRIAPVTAPVRVRALAWSADGKRLAIAAQDGKPRIWNLADPQPTLLPGPKAVPLLTVAFDPAGQRAAFAGVGGRAFVFESDSAAPSAWTFAYELTGHVDDVLGLAFTHDGKRLASGSADGWVKLWDTRLPPGRIVPVGARPQGQEMLTLPADEPVTTLRFSSDGSSLQAGTASGRLIVWPAAPW